MHWLMHADNGATTLNFLFVFLSCMCSSGS